MGITVVDTHADHASGTSITNIQCTTFGGLCCNRGWCPPKTMRSLGASLPNVLAVCIYLGFITREGLDLVHCFGYISNPLHMRLDGGRVKGMT